MDTKELLLTSCKQPQQWSACLWDYSSGNALNCYKNGGAIAPKSLNILGNDYLVTSDEDKPIIQVWPVNSQEPVKKLCTVLPDKAKSLVICPRSSYIAAGIGSKLYLWHLSSGKLFSVQKRHFQPVSCVKFSNCGDFVIVGGEDGVLVVYDLMSLVSLHGNYMEQSDLGQVEPLYTKHDHSMPITDIFVGSFGQKSRLATVSLDQTCKLYDLAKGRLLLSLVFEQPVTSVIFDNPCWNLFVGALGGEIYQFHLKNPPRTLEHHLNNEKTVFHGHKKRILCLDLNGTCTNLVSGSEDCFVFIWEVKSRQILRQIEHKAEITNVKFILNHVNFFNPNFKVKCVLKNLERGLNQSDTFIVNKVQDFDIESSDDDSDLKSKKIVTSRGDLEAENAKLRLINKQLYEAALNVSRKYNNF